MKYNDFIETILKEKIIKMDVVHGGMMNESFLVETNTRKYIAYFPPEHVKGMVDRDLEKFHQNIAYEKGLTSKNYYFDLDSGIKINEYIEGKSLNLVDSYDINKVAELLRNFHSLKPLAKVDYHPFERLEEYEASARSYQSLDKEFEIYKKLLLENKEFLTSNGLVISHNDAQKSNIVKDDNGNYFLIDFEFSANNDEFYDVATFGNNSVEEGYQMLIAYLNGKVTPNDEKRYYLWRIFVSLQWYLVAISKHHKGEGALHNFNFLDVASFFLSNATECFNRLKEKKIIK